MIKDLEARAGGFYTPSAGAIYPTLQLLEDRGWVTNQIVDGRKVYAITDAGREALKERDAQPGPGPFPFGGGPHHGHHHGPHGPFGGHARPELNDLGAAAFDVARLMRQAVIMAQGDPARFAELQRIVEQARAALRQFVGEPGPQGDVTPNGPAETV
jgi:hypothetical protein